MQVYAGVVHNDGQAIEKFLNAQYRSSFIREKPILPTFNCRTEERISDIKFQLDDVCQRLAKLDYKAPGIDQLSPHVLQACAFVLIYSIYAHLSSLIRQSCTALRVDTSLRDAYLQEGKQLRSCLLSTSISCIDSV